MKAKCGYIRKNHMTINEDLEIFEIVDWDNPNQTHAFESSQAISSLLRSSDWDVGATVRIDDGGYQIE